MDEFDTFFDHVWDALNHLAQQPRFAMGDEFGEYVIIQRLGQGGQGEVYAAWNKLERRYQALKFVLVRKLQTAAPDPKATAPMPAAPRSLMDELQEAVRFDLPNFINVHGLKREGDEWFIAMQLAVGGDLSNWPDVGARQVVKWLLPVAQSVHEANRLGQGHFDIKPHNVLLINPTPARPDDETRPAMPLAGEPDRLSARLADFGLARFAAGGNVPAGTDGYAAPEQHEFEWEVPTELDELFRRLGAIDGFGLAATLCSALIGIAPGARRGTHYVPPTVRELMAAGLDRDLAFVLVKQLATDPRQRYESVAAFTADLQRWLSGEPVEARQRLRFVRQLVWAFRKQEGYVRALLSAVPVLVFAMMVAFFIAWRIDEKKSYADRQALEAKLTASKAKENEVQAHIARVEAEKRVGEVESGKTAALHKADKTAAARTAARRGDWPTALKMYDELIREADEAIARRLRVERLFGYFATNDQGTLLRELDELERVQDLGPLAARVKLVRGAYLLCDPNQADDGRKLIRQALGARETVAAGARDTSLSPADVLYAEALLETRPKPLLDKLNAAVKLDVLHYPAHSALVIALITSGDPDAANRQAEVLAGLFPDSPVPAFVRAQTAAINGDQPNMHKALTEFGLKARVDIRPLVEHFELFARVLDLRAKQEADQGKLPKDEQDELDFKTVRMHFHRLAVFRPLAFSVPVAGISTEWHLAIDGQFQQMNRMPLPKSLADLPKWDAAGRRLEEFAKDYPEALAQTLPAINRLHSARVELDDGRINAARARLQDAAEWAYRAAEQPTFAPRSPVRYSAMFSGISADILVLKITPNVPKSLIDRVQDGVPKLIAAGRERWPLHMDYHVKMTVEGVTLTLAPVQSADWKLDTPAGREKYRARNRQLYVVARNLLDSWSVEISARTEDAKRDADKMMAELRSKLQKWGEAEGLILPSPDSEVMSGGRRR